jgi:hypothetical protein
MLELNKGDVVTIGASPSIQLVQYALSVRPSATVQFSARFDVMDLSLAQLAQAKKSLRQLLFEALQVELGFVDSVMEAVEDGDHAATIEGLAALCLKEVECGEEEETKSRRSVKRKRRSG